MSGDESSTSSYNDDSVAMQFNPSVATNQSRHERRCLKHVPGEELHQVLPGDLDLLFFDGTVSRESKVFHRLLYLLQSNRRWRTIELTDQDQTRASPEFLSLVVSAVTKTNEVVLDDCPFDQNFFACLNSGMQTLTHVTLRNGNAPISFDAAAMFANGLAMSGSLERLAIGEYCRIEPGAGLKMVEGIKRSNSLKDLDISETNLGTTAMVSLLQAVSEGCLPTLVKLRIVLKEESDCTNNLTKLMCSDTCHLEKLVICANIFSQNTFRTDGVRRGKGNLKLKSLDLVHARLDESYLTMMLPMMPSLTHLTLFGCGISDLTPIVDHLCRPNAAIESIDIHSNWIGIDQAEKFVGSLADMQSLTDVNIFDNPWCRDDSVYEERAKRVVKKVSKCRNLEKFRFYNKYECPDWARGLDPSLNLAINGAWRRELCYKKSSPSSKLLPLVITRALRKTDHDLRADVVLSLLRERLNDLMPVPND